MPCGANAICSCRVVGGPGIGVEGIGSATVPYVVSFVGGHPAACRAVADCLAAHLDQGLTYNTTTHLLGARLSGDEGNTLRFGTDGGLYTNYAEPSPNDCSTTLASLPESGIVGGYTGAGRLLAPAGTRHSYELAVRLRLPLMFLETWRLVDGAVVSAPFDGELDAWTDVGTAPFNNRYHLIDSMTWQNMLVLPSGWLYDPYTEGGINPNVAVDGAGFYAFREPTQIGGTFLSDVFDRCGGRLVIGCNIHGDERATMSVRDEIQRYCLQASTIGFVPRLEDAGILTDANITPGIRIGNADQAAEFPPADVAAAGITWVTINHALPDDTITGYVDAGLQVLCHPPSRHVHVDRVSALGVRGVLSDDPVYAAGDIDRYRTPRDGWAYRTSVYGQLTAATDAGSINGGRGYVWADPQAPGWFFPAQDPGWLTMLIGWAGGEIASMEDAPYEIDGEMRFVDGVADPNSALGFVICAPDDRSIAANDSGSGTYYVAAQRSGGELFVHKYVDGSGTSLASTTAGGVGIDDPFRLQIQVTPDSITVTRPNPDGTDWQVTTGDTDVRGANVHAFVWTVGTPGFRSRFREIFVNPLEAN